MFFSCFVGRVQRQQQQQWATCAESLEGSSYRCRTDFDDCHSIYQGNFKKVIRTNAGMHGRFRPRTPPATEVRSLPTVLYKSCCPLPQVKRKKLRAIIRPIIRSVARLPTPRRAASDSTPPVVSSKASSIAPKIIVPSMT